MGRESSLTEGMDQLNILTPPAICSKGIFKKRTAHHNLGKEFLYPFFCLFPLPKQNIVMLNLISFQDH